MFVRQTHFNQYLRAFRAFSFQIAKNHACWKVSLIAHTTTQAGLVVRAALDKGHYETGIVVSDEELARVKIIPAKFHGEWNYVICPKT